MWRVGVVVLAPGIKFSLFFLHDINSQGDIGIIHFLNTWDIYATQKDWTTVILRDNFGSLGNISSHSGNFLHNFG